MTVVVDELIDDLEREAASDGEDGPDVGIVMGSDSDLPVMREAGEALSSLGFVEDTGEEGGAGDRRRYESYVVSAHRTPELLYAYGRTARDRGISVIIAGAGGKSADLPNMVASIAYPLPVIGVPVDEKSVDSVIGMPTGAPLVAVDAGKAFNAGLAAAQFLAIEDEALRERLIAYRADLRDEVGAAARALHESGIEQYLADHGDEPGHK